MYFVQVIQGHQKVVHENQGRQGLSCLCNSYQLQNELFLFFITGLKTPRVYSYVLRPEGWCLSSMQTDRTETSKSLFCFADVLLCRCIIVVN